MISKGVSVQTGISLVPNPKDWSWILNANISLFGNSSLMVGKYNATPYINTLNLNKITANSSTTA